MKRFDPRAPLTGGKTLVEASAGTGKTFTITSLYLRLVAEEGRKVDEILVVTFTEAATAELEERIRRRIVEAVDHLEGRRLADHDPVIVHLAECSTEDRERRLRRLRRARQQFDAAAVFTIHGFCQRMLAQHGFSGGGDPEPELVTDVSGLIEEIVDDYVVRELYDVDAVQHDWLVSAAGLRRDALLAVARAAIHHPEAPIAPRVTGDPRRLPVDARSLGERLAEGRGAILRFLEDLKSEGRLRSRSYGPKATPKALAASERWLLEGGLITDEATAEGKSFARLFPSVLAPEIEGEVEIPGLLFELEAIHARARVMRDGPRCAFAHEIRRELPRRLRAEGSRTFDDLLTQLRDALRDDTAGRLLSARITDRFRAALIDEFQDTDHIQWEIFERLFDDGAFPLFLIGDPKQAIYAFRGADVYVYRRAAEAEDVEVRTLNVNHRSDRGYVHAMNALFGRGADPFGLSFVRYHAVDSAERRARPRAWLGRGRPPLWLRWIEGEAGPAEREPAPLLAKTDMTGRIPAAVASDVLRVLRDGEADDGGGATRSLRPSDLTILVRTHRQATGIQDALRRVDVPSVIGADGDVFESSESLELLRWLEALVEPHRLAPARTLYVSLWLGADPNDLVEEGERESPAWSRHLEVLAEIRTELEEKGVVAAFERTLESLDLVERLLALPDGERRLTNLRHLIELLHRVEIRERLGPTGLLRYLSERRDTGGDRSVEAIELRLESDERAVQILTLHRAKGLEFPIVFLPYAWEGAGVRAGVQKELVHRRPDGGRALDLRQRSKEPEKRAHLAVAHREALEEAVRLLYVGFTRARSATVAYFGPVYGRSPKRSELGYEVSPLAALLHGSGAAPTETVFEAARRRVEAAFLAPLTAPYDEVFRADLDALIEAARLEGEDTIAVEPVRSSEQSAYLFSEVEAIPELVLRSVARPPFDRSWFRTSYTDLLRRAKGEEQGAGAPRVAVVGGGLDEASPTGEASDAFEGSRQERREPNVPLAGFPAGPGPGSFVHRLLEDLDFTSLRAKADDLDLEALAERLAPRWGIEDEDAIELLVRHLPSVLEAPLGDLVGGACLASLERRDRLDELSFDLPLAGGAAHRSGAARVASGRIAEILAARASGAPYPKDYPDRVAQLGLPEVSGYLTGSIDLVFRADVDGARRYFVVDYKTNFLGSRDPLRSTLAHYAPDMLAAPMAEHHYVLQYHLYLVALHRYLSHRLGAAYAPETDLGGVLYLFVRGMVGEGSRAEGAGIYADRPPAAVVRQLSALFEAEGGAAR